MSTRRRLALGFLDGIAWPNGRNVPAETGPGDPLVRAPTDPHYAAKRSPGIAGWLERLRGRVQAKRARHSARPFGPAPLTGARTWPFVENPASPGTDSKAS